MSALRYALAATAAASMLLGSYALAPQTSQACIHPEREFKVPISADAQKGILFFDNGRQEMVIRPGYKLDTKGLKAKDDAIAGFTTVAWLIPTPSLPDNYKEVDAKLFTELESFTKAEQEWGANGIEDGQRSPRSHGRPAAGGVEFHEQVKAGDYTIQPIKASGELGMVELKAWFKDNGFAEPKESLVRWYTENEYYWLAVKLHNPKGLLANGQVKPLQIGFKTDKPVYPVRINEGAGKFDLELWVVSRKEIDTKKSESLGLKTVEQRDPTMHQSNRETKFADLPAEVRKVAQDREGLNAMKEGKLYCYRFFATGVNDKIDLSKWKGDLSFEFKPEVKPQD